MDNDTDEVSFNISMIRDAQHLGFPKLDITWNGSMILLDEGRAVEVLVTS